MIEVYQTASFKDILLESEAEPCFEASATNQLSFVCDYSYIFCWMSDGFLDKQSITVKYTLMFICSKKNNDKF